MITTLSSPQRTSHIHLRTHTLFGFIRLFPGPVDRPGFALPVFGNAFKPLMQISNGEGHIEEFVRCTFPCSATFSPSTRVERSVGDRLLQAFHFPGETPFASEEFAMNEFLRARLPDLDPYPSVKLSILRRLQVSAGYMETAQKAAEIMGQRDLAAARSWLLEERQVFEELLRSGELC
ncbi:hypothetical protein ACXR0O_15005 [Verrucomicrobiota bacterium sgz303538]